VNFPPEFDSAESFDPEFFNQELTTEGLVAGCRSLVVKSIKRSVINIQRSMLGVRCSTFKSFSPPGGFTAPARRDLIRSFIKDVEEKGYVSCLRKH